MCLNRETGQTGNQKPVLKCRLRKESVGSMVGHRIHYYKWSEKQVAFQGYQNINNWKLKLSGIIIKYLISQSVLPSRSELIKNINKQYIVYNFNNSWEPIFFFFLLKYKTKLISHNTKKVQHLTQQLCNYYTYCIKAFLRKLELHMELYCKK